jgi:23S rRNA (cytidine1920-2'-O)/16S rRNA (cytidine1409-2'-O)-methyltransferase
MAGKVRVNGNQIDKAGMSVPLDANVEVEEPPRWVSRGALKLLKAITVFGCALKGKVCLDIGASTGGFTDVMLDAGAARVYAVDVGRGQLHWRLANDPRVVVMDGTNARFLTRGSFPEAIEFAACDASFISLRLLLPVIDGILPDSGTAVVLIKPQFEAGRECVSKTKGVVRDRAVHAWVLRDILTFATERTNLHPAALSWSPIRGPEGNVEFLCLLTRAGEEGGKKGVIERVEEVVAGAHGEGS